MRLSNITVKNLRRHFSRVSVLIIGLTVAITTVVSLYAISSTMQRDFADKVDEYGTNIVIVPKTKNLSLTYGGVAIGGFQYESKTLNENDVAKLKTIKNKQNLAIIAPKLMAAVDINNKRTMIMGVSFPQELKMKKWWSINKGKKSAKSNEILIGGNAAKKLNLKIGESVDINKTKFIVAGILNRVGTNEDDLIYADLKQIQRTFNKPNQLSMIEVAAWCTSCPLKEIVRQASAKLPHTKVSGVLQVAKSRDTLINQVILFSIVLSVTVVVVSVLIVFTNMLTSVRERRREIGIFRALGYRKSHILKIILLESSFIGLLSGTLGYFLGYGIARIIAPTVAGVDLYIPTPNLTTAYIAILSTFIVTILASIYPAIVAANLNPKIALETV